MSVTCFPQRGLSCQGTGVRATRCPIFFARWNIQVWTVYRIRIMGHPVYIYISIFDQKATDCFRHLWAFLFHSDGCVTVTEAFFFIIFTHKKYIGRYFLGDVIYIATLWSGVPVSTVVVHLYIRVCINSCCLLIHDVPLKILVERGLVMMVEGEGLMWRWQGAGGGVGQAVGLHLGQRLLDAQRGEAHTWVPVPALSH